MNTQQAGVVAFHRAMGQPVLPRAQALPVGRIPVRVELIREEFMELLEALGWAGEQDSEGHYLFPTNPKVDMVEMADACIDLLYVVKGLLTEAGIDDEPLFDEVQRSNMSKLGADGKPIIAGPNDPDGIFEGRVKKGPNYFKPDLRGILLSGQADLEYQQLDFGGFEDH
ncbi:MazG-like nucleotide pyrophosphohydrolase [Microbacterium phage WilliamStrong]|nr:MazG-like nucleotide pyrophosphohydrolase [Microbacterium phage WilliamStrong]